MGLTNSAALRVAYREEPSPRARRGLLPGFAAALTRRPVAPELVPGR